MNCSACGHANPERAKFCLECGTPFAARCASCGTELPPAAKFCLECGTAVQGSAVGKKTEPPTPYSVTPTAPSAQRKVVTILFADLAGSTALQERLDPESARAFMERYYRAMRAAVENHRGTVVKLLGDGVMAAFGVPRVAEDDAIRAVRAGVEMQQAFRALAGEQTGRVSEIGLRIAVNSGEVVVSSDDSDIVGDPVNVAARLQQEAGHGEVVIGESTQRLVASLVTLAPLGSFALKGRTEAVKAYRVESLERPAMPTAAAFVGRDEELARLTAVYEGAMAAPAARLAVLLGSPGLGKSRLIDELGRRLGAAATVIAAQCDAAGGGTFAPIAAALRQHLAVDAAAGADTLRAAIEAALPPADTDRGRVAGGVAALLAGSPAAPEETFFVIRRLLAGIAAAKPVVLVIDDLHWAEPLLLDLVEHLVQWGSGVPLLVLVGARPELRDTRSSFATKGGLVAEVVTLAGLDAGAATRLAANVIGAADLPAAVAGKLLATSEGNPLFVAELVRMLVQEGALTRDGERWIVGANLAALEMPPTIHALLAARLERLRPEERAVLERAAVVGRHFSRNAVAALLPREASDLDARLESLKRSELIEPDTGWFLGEPVLRFHHVLIRDAAYRRLLKGTRAELHARLADWVEARVGEAAEHDETIGRHLEQAHQHLSELGPLDAHGRSLGERASQRLAAAGRRALAGDDLPLAAGLLGRAIERLDGDDPARADLALDWCEALLAAGDVGPAAAAIAELARFADATREAALEGAAPSAPAEGNDGDPVQEAPSARRPPGVKGSDAGRLRAWQTCFTGQLTVLTAPQGLQTTADAVAAAAAEFAALGDAAGEAKAHQVHAQALARLGRVGACEAALDRALAAARRAGDRRRANAVLAGAPLAALWGPSPVTRASGRCLDVVRVLRITQGAPAVEAVALSCQGVLEALRGRTDAARRMIASSRKMVEELGITHRLLEADAFAGRIELLEGDAVAAERSLRRAYEGLRDLGLGIDAARAAALLARALLAQGRAAEAEALSRESEALAGDDLQAAIAWRGVRAEALAQRGEHAAAIELAQAAVTIAAATDALLDHADARLALAAALRAAGRGGEADAEKRRATELWETKGATLLAERVRRDETRIEPNARAIGASAEPARTMQRRVGTNAATASAAQFDAAFASGDIAAIGSTFINRPGVRVVDHPTESTYGREGAIDSFRRLLRLKDPVVRHEPLATLGDSLGLFRRHISTGGTTGGRFDVADYHREEFVVVEPGVLIEIFAADHLGDAVARLYARYAELLAEGPERQRAAVTARAVTYTLTDSATPDEMLLFSPTYEDIDHRSVGYGTLSTDEATKLVVTQRALADRLRFHVEEILALRPEGLVRKTTTFGIWRDGGGAFERTVCMLSVFGSDGRAVRQETFDDDREVEALARFDQLIAERATRAPRRRVRPNAATRYLERFDAVMSARDRHQLDHLFCETLEVVHHPTGATYGRREMLVTWRSIFKAERFVRRYEVVTTLGDSLAFGRHSVSLEGLADPGYRSFGPAEVNEIVLCEVDDSACGRRFEMFAPDRLGDAVACLYERYAATLPEGPARERAAATAGSVKALASLAEQIDADRLATVVAGVLAPDVRAVDHRSAGFGTLHGAPAFSAALSSLLDLSTNATWRIDDVIALRDNGALYRSTNVGTDRASGGAFERSFCVLIAFSAGGLITDWEQFELEHVDEALARFDELVRSVQSDAPAALRRVRPNAAGNLAGRFQDAFAAGDDAGVGDLVGADGAAAKVPSAAGFNNAASRSMERLARCWAARDWEDVLATLSPALRMDDRRRLMRLEIGFEAFIAQFRMLFDQPGSRWQQRPLATRGERLSLYRTTFQAEVERGGGSLEDEHLSLAEVDADGRCIAVVTFDLEDIDAAYAELDARYEAGEGAVHPAHGVVMRAFGGAVTSRDWEPVIALCAPTFVEHDHRGLAVLGTTHGGEAWAQNFRTLTDLAPDTVYRVDHFRSAERGFCSVGTWHGTRDGGRYEIALIAVIEMVEDGRMTRADIYDEGQLDQARARFAELEAAPVRSRPSPKATRARNF